MFLKIFSITILKYRNQIGLWGLFGSCFLKLFFVLKNKENQEKQKKNVWFLVIFCFEKHKENIKHQIYIIRIISKEYQNDVFWCFQKLFSRIVLKNNNRPVVFFFFFVN